MKLVHANFEAYRQAHQLIWKHKIWRLMVLPVVLTMFYLPFVVVGGLSLGEAFSHWIVGVYPWLGDYSGWVYWVMRVLVFIVFTLFGYFTYRIVVMLFYVPCLEFVAERVEKCVLGKVAEDPKRWYEMIARVVLIVTVTVSISAFLAMLNLAASLIPVVGTALVILCILPFQFFITAVGYLDPYLDRRGYTVRSSLRLLWRHFPTVVLFDAIGTALLLIPIIGWFLGPTYSVVAGMVLGIRLHEEAEKREKGRREGEGSGASCRR